MEPIIIGSIAGAVFLLQLLLLIRILRVNRQAMREIRQKMEEMNASINGIHIQCETMTNHMEEIESNREQMIREQKEKMTISDLNGGESKKTDAEVLINQVLSEVFT